MITGTNISKILTRHMYHTNVYVNSIVENVTLIKIGITINVGVNVKIRQDLYAKKIIFSILLHILVKMIDM